MNTFISLTVYGLAAGAILALAALGFVLIYTATRVINFAQGEFVMLGGMITVFAHMAGLPIPLAALIAIAGTAAMGVALNKLAIEPARGAPVVSLIIITIGASIFIQGVAQLVFDKQLHRFPAFSGDTPISIFGATILLFALPFLPHPGRQPIAVVDAQNCNGCSRCHADCPYEAITMIPHEFKKGQRQALVDPDRCTACGICAGSCPSATPFRHVEALVSGLSLINI